MRPRSRHRRGLPPGPAARGQAIRRTETNSPNLLPPAANGGTALPVMHTQPRLSITTRRTRRYPPREVSWPVESAQVQQPPADLLRVLPTGGRQLDRRRSRTHPGPAARTSAPGAATRCHGPSPGCNPGRVADGAGTRSGPSATSRAKLSRCWSLSAGTLNFCAAGSTRVSSATHRAAGPAQPTHLVVGRVDSDEPGSGRSASRRTARGCRAASDPWSGPPAALRRSSHRKSAVLAAHTCMQAIV